MIIKTCEICGNDFETVTPITKYCSKNCKDIKAQRVYQARLKGLLPPPEKKKPKKVNQEVIEFAKEARKQGMSYGQLQAMETLERMKGM